MRSLTNMPISNIFYQFRNKIYCLIKVYIAENTMVERYFGYRCGAWV